jgi:Cys-tRNA(Pro)/Cys-tRNA(Cys) deacylase
MSTRAIHMLKQKKVTFEVIQYDHQEKGARFASQATGFPLAQTVKTLVVDLGHSKFALALLPGDRELNLKALAKCLKVKRAAMADTRTAERLTGYLVGGISPFGTKQQFKVVMEMRLMDYDNVVINAGQRGVMLKISPDQIINFLRGAIFPISR